MQFTRQCQLNIRNNTQKIEEVTRCGNKWLCTVDDITLGLYYDQKDAIIVHDIAVAFLNGNYRKKLDRAYDIESDKIPSLYRELLYVYIDQLYDKKKMKKNKEIRDSYQIYYLLTDTN